MSTDIFDGAYAGRRVLVTGHTGFLGGWAARWLVGLGAQVAGYSRRAAPAEPVLPAGLRGYRGDITDAPALAAAVADFAPEIILHLAGATVVGAGLRTPGRTYAANALGTAAVLDAAVAHPGVRAVVVMGTPASPTIGDDLSASPYPASKVAMEAVVAGYGHPGTLDAVGRTAPIALGVARPGVMLGGDWGGGRLLADVTRAVGRRERVVLKAPNATRPWQHVLDGLGGALTLAARLRDGDAPRRRYAFGRTDPQTSEAVVDVVEAFLAACGIAGWPVRLAGDGAADRLGLDCAAATLDLGWRPAWDLPPAIRATAAWYETALRDPRALPTLMDRTIADYTKAAAPAAAAAPI